MFTLMGQVFCRGLVRPLSRVQNKYKTIRPAINGCFLCSTKKPFTHLNIQTRRLYPSSLSLSPHVFVDDYQNTASIIKRVFLFSLALVVGVPTLAGGKTKLWERNAIQDFTRDLHGSVRVRNESEKNEAVMEVLLQSLES